MRARMLRASDDATSGSVAHGLVVPNDSSLIGYAWDLQGADLDFATATLSFADNELYKLVFKQYLTFLIREGYTQEFFIEGGRSRTGKIMTPKLGMLAAIVNAFLGGVRRDLYFVPVSIHYGRIVEEDVYGRELTGAEKETESISALLRARRFLKQKYGTVYLSFAEPISLNEVLGDRKQRFVEGADVPEIEDEKRRIYATMLTAMDDAIVNGTLPLPAGAPEPLALFRAARVDYSLHRLHHYTGTDPEVSDLGCGVDQRHEYYVIPPMRSLLLKLSATF